MKNRRAALERRSNWRVAGLIGLSLLAGCKTLQVRRGAVVTALPACADFTVQIYFESRSAVLTREAREVVDAAARRARRCQVAAIDVLGLADAPGAPAANLALSNGRANAVTKALARRGFPPIAFRVVAAGDVGAQTPSGAEQPLRRRAEVVFHVQPRPRP
ncbi:MAG: OmpA family protein [Caulobacteraceae bacterium]